MRTLALLGGCLSLLACGHTRMPDGTYKHRVGHIGGSQIYQGYEATPRGLRECRSVMKDGQEVAKVCN